MAWRNRQVQGRSRVRDLDRGRRAGQHVEPFRLHADLRRDLDTKGKLSAYPDRALAEIDLPIRVRRLRRGLAARFRALDAAGSVLYGVGTVGRRWRLVAILIVSLALENGQA